MITHDFNGQPIRDGAVYMILPAGSMVEGVLCEWSEAKKSFITIITKQLTNFGSGDDGPAQAHLIRN